MIEATLTGESAAGQWLCPPASASRCNLAQINSFVDEVVIEGALDTGRKREALTELNTLAEQAKLPRVERESPKIMTALKLLPGLLSSINSLATEWDKREPWVRSHFGNGKRRVDKRSGGLYRMVKEARSESHGF